MWRGKKQSSPRPQTSQGLLDVISVKLYTGLIFSLNIKHTGETHEDRGL